MTSLRVKIALALAALAFVATAAVGAIGYQSTRSRLIDEVDRSIDDAVSLLSGQLTANGQIRVPARGLLETFGVRTLNRAGTEIRTSFAVAVPVTDEATTVLGLSGGRAVQSVDVGDTRFRIHTIGAARGGLQVARPLTETESVLTDLRRRTAIVVGLISIAAAGVGWLLASTVAAPLRRLTRAAELVEASGSLDVDVPSTGDDEVGRLGTAFRSMLAALQRSRSEQHRLVQDAGHELRTPLTSLRTNLAVIRRHPTMGSDMQERILDDLDSEVTELTDLVNELVSAASGDLADQPAEHVELAELVATVADRVARRKSRAVLVDADQAGTVLAPPAGLERVMTNLIHNAVKFDSSGADIDVVVRGGAVTVLDRGPGIAADDLPHVFERFHRAESSRAMPGSGLGLAIVRDIIERHGGTVNAAPRPGGGAAVGFTLPESGDDLVPSD